MTSTFVVLAAASAIAAVLTIDRSDHPRSIEPGAATAPASPVAGSITETACADVAPLTVRAGLVLVVGLPGVTDADHPLIDELVDLGVGGVMLRDRNIVNRRQATALVTGLRDRLGAHLLVAVDEEGGRVTSMRSVDGTMRSARRLGAAGPGAARAAGRELGEVARSIGIDWVLGPVVDLDDGPADGVIGDRSFGGDPHEVAVVAGAYAAGLRSQGVAVSLKHFPGHGRADSEPHAGTTADHRHLDDLEREDLLAFDALMAAGAESVMLGHVIYPEIWGRVPASLTPGAYDLLREHGFDGVAITDALGMGAIYNEWGFDRSPAMALRAGADAILATQGDRAAELRDGIVDAVRSDGLAEERLDEAVARVLRLRGQDATGIVCG